MMREVFFDAGLRMEKREELNHAILKHIKTINDKIYKKRSRG